MMMLLAWATGILAFSLAQANVGLRVGAAQRVDILLTALVDPVRTNDASQALVGIGSRDQRVRELVVLRLPSLLRDAADHPKITTDVLYEEVRVAGDLRIKSAVPPLIALLQMNNENGGPLTMTRQLELRDDPVGRALCLIRDDASLGLFDPLLKKTDGHVRGRALRVLVCFNTPASKLVLEDVFRHEQDEGIRRYLLAHNIGTAPEI